MTHKYGILTFSMHEVDRYGISTVMERAVESINPRYGEIFATVTKMSRSAVRGYIIKVLRKSQHLFEAPISHPVFLFVKKFRID